MQQSTFKKTKAKLLTGFYLGFWPDGMYYSRKIFSLLTCLQKIGGFNKIFTDMGSWLNMFLCAGLVQVYIAEAYSEISKNYAAYVGSSFFKCKTIIKHRVYCCRYDDKFEDERAHVQTLLEELSVQLSLENL